VGGDRDQRGHRVRGRSCARCFATHRSETAREGSGCPPNRTIPTPGWFFFSFFFCFFFSWTVFFCHGLVSFFSRKAARCERCSPWKKKEVSWCAREEDQVLILLDIFLLFFSFQKKLTAGNRKERTGKPHRAGSGTTGYGGGR
jgi:hypothetical protein